eukprot:3547868-Pyramimonas_sp.AAC.1
MMPWPRGTWQPAGGGRAQRVVIHDPRGPCHTARAKPDPLKGYANTLVLEGSEAGWTARALHPKEIWCAQGGRGGTVGCSGSGRYADR